MNKSEIRAELEQVARDAGYPKGVAEDLFDAFVDIIVDAMVDGKDVKISNFGKFIVRERPPVERRNPRTGEALAIPAKRAILFHPSPALREKLNP